MPTLYKFIDTQEPALAMAGGSLKFARIDELNDPSELVSYMNRNAVYESLVAIRKTGYSQRQFEWLSYQEDVLRILSPETRVLSRPATIAQANETLRLSIYDNLDFMEQRLLQTIALIRSRVGVLSLTERFNSLPMWAHYGAQAHGYVVRFEGLDHEFPPNSTGSLNVLKPVKYVEEIVGLTHDPTTQDNLFFSKFQDWRYEREWRVVKPLSGCEFSSDKKMYLWKIDPSTVTGVICGWNVSADKERSLAAKLEGINPSAVVSRASLNRGRVELNAKAK